MASGLESPGGVARAAPGMKRWPAFCALGLILLAGALVRYAYLKEFSREPEFSSLEVDALFHDYWARALVTGGWSPPPGLADPLVRSTPYLRPPGYPFFLAALYRLFGTGYLAPRIVQACLGLLACLLGFTLARRRFGTGAGLVFAALMSLYWSFIYFEAEFLEPVLLVFLGLALIGILDRWTEGFTPPRAAVAGFLLGLLALIRPTVLLFGAAVPLWAWRLGDRRRLGPGRWSARLLLFGAVAGATILPATLRNLAVSGELFLVSANAGINLYLGNNEQATGRVSSFVAGLGPFATCFDYRTLVRALEKKVGRRLTDGEVAEHFRGEAYRFVRERPGRALALAAQKTLLFWGPLEVSHNREDEIVRARSAVLKALPGNFSFAAAAGALGLLLFMADRRAGRSGAGEHEARQTQFVILLSLYVLATFAAHLPFFVAGRYRVPVVPGLLLLGSYGLWRIAEEAAGRRLGAAACWTATGVLLYALLSRNPVGYAPDPGKWAFARGRALAIAGDAAGARRAYEETLRLNPGFAPAHTNLGVLLMRAGDLGGAERHFREATSINPGDPVAFYDLGLVLARAGDEEAAIGQFEKVLSINPDLADAHEHLGRLLEQRGDIGGAALHLGEAARIRRDARTLLRLAASLRVLGHRAEADRYDRLAREIAP